MTKEDQRIAIAEAVGWTELRLLPEEECQSTLLSGLPPVQKEVRIFVPDYLNDLNASHQIERNLVTTNNWIAYMENLSRLCMINTTLWEYLNDSSIDGKLYKLVPLVNATAAQRSEAFLKTLGLWKPSSVVMEKGQS